MDELHQLRESIRSFIEIEVQQRLDRLGLEDQTLDGDVNLVLSGILDSLSFIEFVSTIETDFGVEVDFVDKDPEDFATISGLVNCVCVGS